MRRISDESGELAGWRNVGRLCLFLVPAALGGAATLWLVAITGWVDLTRELRIERRTMQSVGLSVMPRAAIRLVIHDDLCLKVDASYLDGARLQFYVKNTCGYALDRPNFSYQLKAHDGTVIGGHRWAFDGDLRIQSKERREEHTTFDNDPRIELIELWVID